jgi:hypothetical protein
MKIDKRIIVSAAGLIAAGIGTYFFLRRRAANSQREQHVTVPTPQSLIRNVMHKSKEAQA